MCIRDRIGDIEKRLITISEYHKMAEVGILTEKDKVELLNGEIIQLSPINSKHGGHVKRINKLLGKLLDDLAIMGVQDPIVIPDFSEPEPDISVLKPEEDDYTTKHPTSKDVYFLIEVSDSTLYLDRTVKLPIYAEAKIKEYWIVNLVDNSIEVYKNPQKDNYDNKSTYHIGDEIELTDFNLKIKVSDVLR